LDDISALSSTRRWTSKSGTRHTCLQNVENLEKPIRMNLPNLIILYKYAVIREFPLSLKRTSKCHTTKFTVPQPHL
jgi:hypothetical protein